jgi:hypothetical protein
VSDDRIADVKGSTTIRTAWETLRLPGVRIEMSGDERCRELYEAYTRRHDRLRIIQNKRWGVALLPIPESFEEEYLRDPRRAHLRKQVSRADRAGYTFARFDPRPRLQEVLAINRSAPERQGSAMHPAYFDEETVRRYLGRTSDVFGVFDAEGVLRAYFCLRMCGSVACGERVLGHADHLSKGIMYQLIAGTVRELSERRRSTGNPIWLYYDTFPGASPGMRQYKRWIGCEPYRVSWVWRAPKSPAAVSSAAPTRSSANQE